MTQSRISCMSKRVQRPPIISQYLSQFHCALHWRMQKVLNIFLEKHVWVMKWNTKSLPQLQVIEPRRPSRRHHNRFYRASFHIFCNRRKKDGKNRPNRSWHHMLRFVCLLNSFVIVSRPTVHNEKKKVRKCSLGALISLASISSLILPSLLAFNRKSADSVDNPCKLLELWTIKFAQRRYDV